jgi:hypothetical protein
LREVLSSTLESTRCVRCKRNTMVHEDYQKIYFSRPEGSFLCEWSRRHASKIVNGLAVVRGDGNRHRMYDASVTICVSFPNSVTLYNEQCTIQHFVEQLFSTQTAKGQNCREIPYFKARWSQEFRVYEPRGFLCKSLLAFL